MACFHILWSDSKFDWECHATYDGAEQRAQELARPGERFSIERCGDSDRGRPCPGKRLRHASSKPSG